MPGCTIDFLDHRKQQCEDKDDRTPILKKKTDNGTPPSNENLAQRITQIGSKVKLYIGQEIWGGGLVGTCLRYKTNAKTQTC